LLPQGLNTILLFNQAQNIPGLTTIKGFELWGSSEHRRMENGEATRVASLHR
jgi:hypothetical protein